MTKQSIVSIIDNISDSYQTDIDNNAIVFRINDTEKLFAIRIKNCGSIYCNGIRIDNTDLVDFTNDGQIISIFNYSAIEKIEIL